MSPACLLGSREEDRRQLSTGVQRARIHGTPGFEELNQLLARAVFVPMAIAPDDFEQRIGGFRALVVSVQCHGEIEPRLMILSVRRHTRRKLG